MATFDFGGTHEEVTTPDEFPIAKAQKILHHEIVAVLGYGVMGRAQSLNMRDNKINIIVGQRQGSTSWDKAIADGWIPGKTLFSLDVAAEKASVIAYLLSDAGQKIYWPTLKQFLKKGKTLAFAHGFSITYKKLTGVVPPHNINVVLVAPKGSAHSVRQNFVEGNGINASYAIFQDASGNATEIAKALSVAIGSFYLFPTTFKKEVYGDLTGERGILVGALTGVMEAQYSELRKHGHSPSEAFNETVEELTQSLIKLVGENGMDWLYANISSTAKRGALDWKGEFRKAVAPVFSELYKKVADGTEAKFVLDKNSQPDYQEKLRKELEKMHFAEMWRAGETVRKLRPEKYHQKKHNA